MRITWVARDLGWDLRQQGVTIPIVTDGWLPTVSAVTVRYYEQSLLNLGGHWSHFQRHVEVYELGLLLQQYIKQSLMQQWQDGNLYQKNSGCSVLSPSTAGPQSMSDPNWVDITWCHLGVPWWLKSGDTRTDSSAIILELHLSPEWRILKNSSGEYFYDVSPLMRWYISW